MITVDKKQRSLPNHAPGLRSGQAGATLIVGLVLLLVLTVVGVSGMNTATMEIQMASNTQFQQDAFQQAEDAIDIAISNRMYRPGTTVPLNWVGNPDYDRRATIIPRDSVVVPVFGSSVGEIRAFHWDIVAVGRGPRNATAQHSQSFYVPARNSE
jgi:type IV pilus assembly protein PilX